MKGKVKRILSGMLSVMTILTSVVQPAVTYAAEPETAAYEAEYPALDKVKDMLSEDEIVMAQDYEVEAGSSFDVKTDFSNMEINPEKVKVTFHEAKNEADQEFDVNRADSYKAVYFVEPVSGNPCYHVVRKIIVKEPFTEAKAEKSADSGSDSRNTGETESEESEDSESHMEAFADIGTELATETAAAESEAIQSEIQTEAATENATAGLSETELDAALEAAESQDTVDEESGLTLGDVMLQAVEQDVDLLELEEGESATFMAEAPRLFAAKASQSVDVTRGSAYYYADYGLGSYVTYPYTVKFGSVTATAYCVQPSKAGPGDGNYTITKLGDSKTLAKVCYYGTKASGDEGFFAEKHPDFSAGKRFIITHIAAAYANGSSDAFSGTNSTGQALAMELYNYCVNQPEIPDVAMSFSNANVTAYVDGNVQRTEEITFMADALQTITMKLPDGVKFHNVTTGKTSKAGADVEVSGGTKFYLSAPLTQTADVSGSWSATMKGSVTKDYSAYKITTGGDTQDLALVFGEGVTDEKYVDFSVKWVEVKAKVQVIKVDSKKPDAKLAGAVFGIYSDKDCTQLISQMPETDKNGASAIEIIKTQDTVYLKEITAPTGYRINASAYNVKLEVNQTASVTVPDEEQYGELTVYKEGQVLVGADATEEGVVFRYENRRQPGAVYNVYAGEDISTAYGASVYKKGDLVKENLTTDSNGAVVLKNLHLGTYIVKEVQAPENFYNAGEEKEVVLSYAGQTVEAVFSETTFTNERQKAKVTVAKQDKDTKNPLDGGIFGLYAGNDITAFDGTVVVNKGTLIEKAMTGEDGNAVFTADLPIGFGYDVKEEQAPDGYVRNTEDVYSFAFSYTNDSEAEVSFSHTFLNERVNAKITLHKKDAETNEAKAQGDATLEKAVYGLYAREDIVHPDGATGVIYKAGDKVAALTTDAHGEAFAENLYLGNYYVKEITPPVGYLADEKEHDLVCNYEGDLKATVERECTSLEQVKKQPFQIIKAAGNGKTDADLLSGAGFTAYLVSSLKTKEDGSYDFASAEPVVIGANGAVEMFTDEKGYACSIALPYGTYLVRETTTPHNYKPVADFLVRITEHNPDTPQTWRVLLDEEFKAKLKIVKQDDETKKPVLAKNAEFKVYDLDNKKYVEQVTTYPSTVTHKSYFTDGHGYLILPQNLKIGNYRIEEVNAPYGYTLNENYFEVSVDSNTAYQMESVSGDAVIEVIYENHPVKGELKIVKQGEILDGFDKNFSYKKENLAGAVFEVYAAENIYTADFQKDSDGNRILEYAADTLVATLTTDEKGEAVLKNLPLGSYRVVEVSAPEGFVLNEAAQIVTFRYADQNTPVITQEAVFENDRQKVEVSVVKRDAETKAEVAGAVFGLYAKEDILAHGEVIAKADTLLGKALSEEDGKAVFALDVPFGSYYMKELTAPAGYVSSDKVLEVTASYQGQEIKVVELESEFENEPTKISIKKTDITTGVELSGATLTVFDKDGNVVDTWKSVKGQEHIMERLAVGETYTLREELAPYGYLQAEEITFTVEDTAEVQKVEMKDDVPTGLLLINKKGEFLEDVSVVDSVGGWISHLFGYLSGSLKEVTFEVYALEDIKAADGESDDYYKKDERIAEITTDDTGVARLGNLPLGKYYVKEKETAGGYVLDGEIREVDLSYRDQNTAEVTYSTDWQNNRQKVAVSVLKKEKDSDRVLEGAVFALSAKEDITNKDGKVIMEAGTVIEEKATDKEGRLTFTADLPIGFSYSVKETAPAPGFATTDAAQEFTFTHEDSEKETISYEFVFEDEPTVFEFTKTSLTDGKEVEGAKLQIRDGSGKVVDEWTSGKEPHIIKELVVGKEYTMTETLPADGYVTAESITFAVEDTAKVQKVEMKDDVTKVEISKTDLTDGKELPGAKLKVTDGDGDTVDEWTSTEEPHHIEKLVVGKKYILTEIQPADGYVTAESIEFTVNDTAEVQKVEMKDDVTKVEISKTDISGKELPGAKLTIFDKDGKVVESWTSTDKPHYIEMLPIGEYTLREESAPEGYLVAEDVAFEVKDTGEIQKVVMKDEVKPEETPETPQPSMDTPKTGDDTHVALWLVLCGLALAGLAGSVVLLRRKKK